MMFLYSSDNLDVASLMVVEVWVLVVEVSLSEGYSNGGRGRF
jgi:hypothetical protein